MRFEFKVSVEVERESGKFASRDEIAEELRTALADADPGQVSGVGADGDSYYNTIEWEVNDGD
jgi:hypothetical protein